MAPKGYTTISLSDRTYKSLRGVRDQLFQQLGSSVSMDQVVEALLREVRDDRALRRLGRVVVAAQGRKEGE